MCEDTISSDQQVKMLKVDLERFHEDSRFSQCRTMGEITFLNIAILLDLKNEAPVRLLV